MISYIKNYLNYVIEYSRKNPPPKINYEFNKYNRNYYLNDRYFIYKNLIMQKNKKR